MSFLKGYAKKYPEHGGNETDGEREESLDRIAEDRSGTGGETGKPTLTPAEYGDQ